MSGGSVTLVLLSALVYFVGGVLAVYGFRVNRQIGHLKRQGVARKAVVVEARHGPRASRTSNDSQYWVEAEVDGAPKRLRACVAAKKDALFLDQRLEVLHSPRYPEVFFCDKLSRATPIAAMAAGLGYIVFITLVLVLG